MVLPIVVTSYQDDTMHLALLSLSIALMAISANAFKKARQSRYLLLMLAFVFFFLDQAVTTYQEFYLSGELIAIPMIDLHLVHLFELLMSLSFIAALLQPSHVRTRISSDEPR